MNLTGSQWKEDKIGGDVMSSTSQSAGLLKDAGLEEFSWRWLLANRSLMVSKRWHGLANTPLSDSWKEQ